MRMSKEIVKDWDEIETGGSILEPGSSAQYETGSWRTLRPVLHLDKCVHCLLCWIYCPDSAIVVKDGKVVGFDYFHCKGCGICAQVCPDRIVAIEMVGEE